MTRYARPFWLLAPVLVAAWLTVPAHAADTESNLDGTWSGDWMVQGGVPDAVTVRISYEDNGTLTAKFVTPTPMDCTVASYAAKTHTVKLEATDKKSGDRYTLEGKLSGNEIVGTIDTGTHTGSVRLIKWTFLAPLR